MPASFKVYYTDPMRGHHASGTPLQFPTEYDALRAAVQAIRHGWVVWKIERPDGTVIPREEIYFICVGHTGA